MFSSQILDVAIGLGLMFLFQAILVSGINELLVVAVAARGKQMRIYLSSVLNTDLDEKNGFFEKFAQSPFIKGLQHKNRFPSYISTQNFAHAVVETLARDQELSTNNAFEKLRDEVETLSDSDFKKILKSKLDSADHNVEKFKAGVEEWYESYMERVSYWYKQKTKFFLYLFAFVSTVALNVDSFKVMNELWRSEKLRESIVGLATEVAHNELFKDSIQTGPTASSSIKKIQQEYNSLNVLDYPITWEYEYAVFNQTTNGYLRDKDFFFRLKWSWNQLTMEKLLGFLVTTLAVSIGAPIWYDILKGLLNARTAIKNVK